MKAKIKSYGDRVTDFYDKEIPKMDSNHACLAVKWKRKLLSAIF